MKLKKYYRWKKQPRKIKKGFYFFIQPAVRCTVTDLSIISIQQSLNNQIAKTFGMPSELLSSGPRLRDRYW